MYYINVQYPNSKMTTTYLGLQEKQSPLTLLQCCSWNQKECCGKKHLKTSQNQSLLKAQNPYWPKQENLGWPKIEMPTWSIGPLAKFHNRSPMVSPTWWASDAVVRCSNSLAAGKRPKPRWNQQGVAFLGHDKQHKSSHQWCIELMDNC